ESFAKLDFWFKSRLSEFQKRSLLGVNEAFEILSNEELGQKAGFSKDSSSLFPNCTHGILDKPHRWVVFIWRLV
ncbi:MAG: hypothetical protein AAF600_17140, partial [Bacteroidota bacterium]